MQNSQNKEIVSRVEAGPINFRPASVESWFLTRVTLVIWHFILRTICPFGKLKEIVAGMPCISAIEG